MVHSGTKNKFNMPVMLSFWGHEEKKTAVIEIMARRGYKLNTLAGRQTGNVVPPVTCVCSLMDWETC